MQLAQIEAQINALKAQITAETHRTQSTVKASEAEFDRNHRNYQDRKITSVAEVEEAQASLRAAEAALNASRSKLQRYQPIATEGAIAKEQYEEAKLAVEQHQQEVAAAKARLQSAKAALNPSSAEVAIARQRIAQDKNASQVSISALNKEKESLIREQLEIRQQLEQENRELKQVESV